MAYNDNKDILSWKRLITSIQTNDKLGVVKESINEGGVHKLRVDQQTHIEAEHHNVVVSSNDMGIIVDIYDKESDNIDTNTYWNDDVMESKNIKEGTWSVPETPEQVQKLSNLLKNPLDAETALDELYDVFGDDELFDDLEVMKRDEPETDVRHVIIRRLKDMNFIKEVREMYSKDASKRDLGNAKAKEKEDRTLTSKEREKRSWAMVASKDYSDKETVNEDHNIDLLRKVARQMEDDAHKGDYTAIEEMLQNVSEEEMEAFLSDHRSQDWDESVTNE